MKNNALIGYTGTVGQSLLDIYKKDTINSLYNSKNISDIQHKSFDTLFIAGISANKWFANSNEQTDLDNINSLLDNRAEGCEGQEL